MPCARSDCRTLRRTMVTIMGRIGAGAAWKKFRGPLSKLAFIHPARVQERPIEMILRGPLEGPGNGALFLAEPAIEVDLVPLFQVPAG
jgi:hypothetical protein